MSSKAEIWHRRWLDAAKFFSDFSKDTSLHIGAVIVSSSNQLLSIGWNGFPRGIADDERLNDRPSKLAHVVHAEENAIFNAARNGISTEGTLLYLHGLLPCSDCAKAIIQAGIDRIIIRAPKAPERWREQMELAADMLAEAGVDAQVFEVLE